MIKFILFAILLLLGSCSSLKEFSLPSGYHIECKGDSIYIIKKDLNYYGNNVICFSVPIYPSKYTIINDEYFIFYYKNDETYIYIYNQDFKSNFRYYNSKDDIELSDVLDELKVRTGVNVKLKRNRNHYLIFRDSYIALELNR